MLITPNAIAAITVLLAAWLAWRLTRRSAATGEQVASTTSEVTQIEAHHDFPPEGLLVAEEVLRVAGSSSVAIWDALDAAAVPVAVEYFPVSDTEIRSYRTVPINAAAQKSIVDIVKALNPTGPTLYRVVLPKGAELVRAAGTSGFRGFARSGSRITSQAVLKPIAAGGALAASWPVFAVAGTVMVMDMVAQRELRAHQRRVEAILGRQEERHYIERIKDQRSADAQLSRTISLMLDGRNPNVELALKSADDEFHRSQQFLGKYRGVIEELVDGEGKVDYRRLEKALGGKTKDLDHFFRELHMARGAITIKRKALIADAASVALTDPTNPYSALRKFLDSQAHQLEEADDIAVTITEKLVNVELKGGWPDSHKKVHGRQQRLRALATPPSVDEASELRFLRTATGEVVQVVPIEEAAADEDTKQVSPG